MYIIVIGGGNTGSHLTRTLLASGNEVLAIERAPHRCVALQEELGSIVLQGDGTDTRVLQSAGVSRADILIAATESDEDNLMACQLAKYLFQVPRTIALLYSPENKSLFQNLKVDVILSLSDMVLTHVEEEVSGHPLVHLAPLRDGLRELVSIHIPADAEVVGKTLDEVPLPPDTLVSLIISPSGELWLPGDDHFLEGDDEVMVVIVPGVEEVVLDALTRVGEE